MKRFILQGHLIEGHAVKSEKIFRIKKKLIYH
jgi:hypothetical protein